MVTVPQGLEEAVGEAQNHDVLHSLLAEKMIDPIDLRLVQGLQDPGIELPGRGQVMAEGLLDDDAPPLARPRPLGGQARGPELVDDGAEEPVGHRQIEQAIGSGCGGLLDRGQKLAQPPIAVGVGEITLQIAHAAGEPAPGLLVDMVRLEFAAVLGDELVHHLGQILPPILGCLGGQIDPDEPKLVRQSFRSHQIVERGNDQPLGEVSGRAEDHHGAGWRDRRRFRRNVVLGVRVGHRMILHRVLSRSLGYRPAGEQRSSAACVVMSVRATPWPRRRPARARSRTSAAAP
jgi:hypothetical protein